MAHDGTEIFHVRGNHGADLITLDSLLTNSIPSYDTLILKINSKRMFFFHGDLFDASLSYAHWLLRFGNLGLTLLVKLSKLRSKGPQDDAIHHYPKTTLPHQHSNLVPVLHCEFKNNLMKMATSHHIDHIVGGNGDWVRKELLETKDGEYQYLNPGNWTTQMTALEYSFKRWKIYRYAHDKLATFYMDEELKAMDINELIASLTHKTSSGNTQEMKTG